MYAHDASFQCATHLNLGWKIRVTDSATQYVSTNSQDGMPTTTIGVDFPPPCPELVEDEEDAAFPLHTSLPLFVSLVLVNTLALLFI